MYIPKRLKLIAKDDNGKILYLMIVNFATEESFNKFLELRNQYPDSAFAYASKKVPMELTYPPDHPLYFPTDLTLEGKECLV